MKTPLPVIVMIVFILINNHLQQECIASASPPQDQTFAYADDNQRCLKCHGHKYYYYYNDWVERDIKARMNPYLIIDSAMFYESNHRYFSCTDCHSEDFNTFPHPGELRMEPKLGCLDCHGGDDTYAHYNFEKIDEEFHESVHSSKHSDEFTCWMCHNPHEYKISARTNEEMTDFIQYDNEICLSCHADISKYQLLTTLENPNVLEKHEWLPNEALHFKHVRCIECHTEISNELLVAHKVLPKDQAVKRCVDCHSKNSRLLASLYKMQFTDQRSLTGFSNAEILGEGYIIGANRNYYLNRLSIIIFGTIVLLVLIHAALRIILIKSKKA